MNVSQNQSTVVARDPSLTQSPPRDPPVLDGHRRELTLPGPPVEPESWADLEQAARRNVYGPAEGAMNYALVVLGQARSEIEQQFLQQTQELQAD